MARYTVTHACGHDQEHQLFGTHADRERSLDWLAEDDCKVCCAKGQEAMGPAFLVRLLPANGSTPIRVELSCWRASYGIRDQLGGRGWRYDRYAPRPEVGPINLLDEPTCKGWTAISEDYAWSKGEIDWIVGKGWEIVDQSQMATLLRSVSEGRSDLIGGLAGGGDT